MSRRSLRMKRISSGVSTNLIDHEREVVHESVRLIRKRAAHTVVRVRPWLQDFKDYAFDRRIFGVTEVKAQIKGADDAGASGWMLWNPKNDYTGVLEPALKEAMDSGDAPATLAHRQTPAANRSRHRSR